MRALLGTIVALVLALAAGSGCDRRIEPFDPDEQVAAPDLSRIFPEGAERSRELEQAEAAPTPAGGRGAPPVAAAGQPIRGTLVLASELEGSVPGGGVLFLVARSPAGGPPVAVQRIPAPSFPLDFEIGPDDRMIQAIPFEGPLQLSARIDADGNATTRQPGDLQGTAPTPVDPGATNITIQINQKL